MTAGRSILPALDIPTRLLAASLGSLLLSLLAMLFITVRRVNLASRKS